MDHMRISGTEKLEHYESYKWNTSPEQMLNTKNILHTNLDLNKLFYKFSTKSGNVRHF